MKKWIAVICILLVLGAGLGIAFQTARWAAQAALAEQVLQSAAVPTEIPEIVPITTPVPETLSPTEVTAAVSTEVPTQAPVETTAAPRLTLTEEEEELLLKIGMAERGDTYCTDCIALVMRTVLNRVESPKFSSTIKGVIYAEDQFTPVMDGSFADAIPNIPCHDALEMIREGWDESQGALYYEWCEGESWHSRNLNLLFQHCDTRFYN